ncbi:MAG TPA: hypothetical protein VHX20_10595 [Terracidiphilus sp.]|jgi:hypothetical protein|nr:hypothetical protein [Terracidiphilus sp.]
MSRTSSLLYEQDGDRQRAAHARARYAGTIDGEAMDAGAIYHGTIDTQQRTHRTHRPEASMAAIHRDTKLLPSKTDGSYA